MIGLWFYVPVDTKYVISETFPKPVSWLGMEKTKPNTTEARITQSKNIIQHKIDTKKLKPGLVAFYDIRSGNGAGLFSKEKLSKGGDK